MSDRVRMGAAGTLAAVVGLIGGCGPRPEVRRIATAAELKDRLAARQATVIDALPAASFRSGHIPGSISLPYDQVSAERLPTPKDAAVIFYCAGKGCPVSAMAANRAVKLGYTNVSIYEDGMAGWRSAGLPVETGP